MVVKLRCNHSLLGYHLSPHFFKQLLDSFGLTLVQLGAKPSCFKSCFNGLFILFWRLLDVSSLLLKMLDVCFVYAVCSKMLYIYIYIYIHVCLQQIQHVHNMTSFPKCAKTVKSIQKHVQTIKKTLNNLKNTFLTHLTQTFKHIKKAGKPHTALNLCWTHSGTNLGEHVYPPRHSAFSSEKSEHFENTIQIRT